VSQQPSEISATGGSRAPVGMGHPEVSPRRAATPIGLVIVGARA
jgi:hypothetical protein